MKLFVGSSHSTCDYYLAVPFGPSSSDPAMAEVSAPRSALSALSVNNAHHLQSSHNTRLSLSHKPLSKANAATAASFDTANTAAKRSSLTKRQSLSSTRQSLLPASSNTSRHSLSSRNSLSHPSRPSSLTHSSTSTRGDPRPIHDKSYLKAEIQKIIAYAATNHYHNPLSVKVLTSPSSKDFKALMLWLVQRVDGSFEWTDGGKEVEDDIKRVMRLFGYPFNVSKNAIIAAGTPHTWPSLLVMIGWLVDFLSYDEAVNGWYDRQEGDVGQSDGVEEEGEEFDTERCYFRYMCASYSAMMAEDTQSTQQVEDALAASFNRRTQRIERELTTMESRRLQLAAEGEAHRVLARQVAELRQRRANFESDKERFLVYKAEMEAHLSHQNDKATTRQAEVEERQRREAELKKEQAALNEAIACQEFTPLQLQSMLHQQQLLTDTLTDIAQQQTRATAEVYEGERSISERLTSLHSLLSEYNKLAVAVELVPVAARHAAGGEYSLRVTEESAGWVTPNPTTAVQPHLAVLHRQLTATANSLTAQVRGLHDDWQRLSESNSDKSKQAASTRSQCDKREESYKRDKEDMNNTLRQLIEQVEAVEAKVNEQRNSSDRHDRETAEKALAEVEAERVRRDVEWRDVRVREQRDMWSAIEELVAHVERIHSVLGGLRGLANGVKLAVEKPLPLEL